MLPGFLRRIIHAKANREAAAQIAAVQAELYAKAMPRLTDSRHMVKSADGWITCANGFLPQVERTLEDRARGFYRVAEWDGAALVELSDPEDAVAFALRPDAVPLPEGFDVGVMDAAHWRLGLNFTAAAITRLDADTLDRLAHSADLGNRSRSPYR